MQFKITRSHMLAIVSVEGSLNALDLLFMLQSREYKNVIAKHNKVLVDYSGVLSSSLTLEDAMGLTLLGKMDLDTQGEIHLVIVVNENEREVMEKVTGDIFSNSMTTISIVKSRQEGMAILRGSKLS
ncbi:hypothetical protein [Paraglaciecola sp. 2405UD69-4]|uniref:hypothetical protein n=1 Tax=Paraglaciecola sp. 2405UD69-4 TaxID=3391836 RepID=UPI0039C9692C